MGMGEICGKLDGAWKTLGGNGAGLGKRGCNWARLSELLCRRVFVPARLPGGDPRSFQKQNQEQEPVPFQFQEARAGASSTSNV